MAQNWIAPWLSLWSIDGGSGRASQDGSPWLRGAPPGPLVNGKGDPELEGRIIRDVATYGAQIGQLAEIVIALADGAPPPAEAVAKLKAMAEKVEVLKKEHAESALARARAALDELKTADAAGYRILLASLKASGS